MSQGFGHWLRHTGREMVPLYVYRLSANGGLISLTSTLLCLRLFLTFFFASECFTRVGLCHIRRRRVALPNRGPAAAWKRETTCRLHYYGPTTHCCSLNRKYESRHGMPCLNQGSLLAINSAKGEACV